MAKKKTLAEQYEKQLQRVEKTIMEMQKRGYTVVGDFSATTPKKVTSKMVDDLKKITPKALARLADKSYNIDIGHKKQVVQKVKASKKIDYRKKPASARPPKPLPSRKTSKAPVNEGEMILRRIYDILNTPYDTGLTLPPYLYYQYVEEIRGLLDTTIAEIGSEAVIRRFAEAGEAAIESVEGYVYSSESIPIHIQSWYTFVDILTNSNIPDAINDMISDISDWEEIT